MDLSKAKRILTLILVLLCAILVANTFANILMKELGLTGITAFIAGFVLYAAFFFGILYFFERFFNVHIFNFGAR